MAASTQHVLKYVWLDLARGLAALAVVASHLRSFVFVDFGEASRPGAIWKMFYFLTGLGHQAVMVFFVMSGFLIGKHVYQAFAGNRWSWMDYCLKRLSRLWIVLIPALLATAGWDYIGIHFYHGALYSGLSDQIYRSTPRMADAGLIYRPETFFGNMLFLQTILVPTFGTNGPLWSLANEFWYYVIFPLGAYAVLQRSPLVGRLASGVAAVALCAVLPPGMVLYGLVWLLGFGVFVIEAHLPQPRSLTLLRTFAGASLGLLLATLLASKILPLREDVLNFMCAAAFSVMLYVMTAIRLDSRAITRVAAVLSNMSYTLYLTHFPLIALLSCAVLGGARLQPGLGAMVIYIGLLLLALVYAFLMYCLFERNTSRIQAGIRQRLVHRPASL